MISKLSPKWQDVLSLCVGSETLQSLSTFLVTERKKHDIYPPEKDVYTAFELCPPESVRVVIVGQDPYHGEGEAHGLAFSVQNGVKCPPSLQNILKEAKADLGRISLPGTDLSPWARQGVLLLNTTLTVRKDSPMSHAGKGWEEVTTEIIRAVSYMDRPIVFLLWGKHAQQFASLVTNSKHLVLTAPHPSPLSAHRGFFGCKHFSKANAWLEKNGVLSVVW